MAIIISHYHKWITELIKFLSNKPLYGLVPDPFPWYGTRSRQARLNQQMDFNSQDFTIVPVYFGLCSTNS